MSRRDHERLGDILAAIEAIHAHLRHNISKAAWSSTPCGCG
ncbi:MAG: hypothetical protein ACR2J5_08365 [Geodermatophilaceae bacterium]